MLRGKKILIGVSASIAAYKIILLVRFLKKEGADVQLLLTPTAHKFVSALTLSTLSEREVLYDWESENNLWTNHVQLGLWADLLIIAPATANTIAKMAHGSCDNLVLGTYLSAKCRTMVFPAMDLDMYKHPAVQNNLSTLSSYGNIVFEASSGELASGLEGKGRLQEPEEILAHIKGFFNNEQAV